MGTTAIEKLPDHVLTLSLGTSLTDCAKDAILASQGPTWRDFSLNLSPFGNVNVTEDEKEDARDLQAIADGLQESTLARACRRCDLFQVQALLRDKADPNQPTVTGGTLLQDAAAAGETNVVAFLLGSDADMAACDELEEIPQHVSALLDIFQRRGSVAKADLDSLSLDPGALALVRAKLGLGGREGRGIRQGGMAPMETLRRKSCLQVGETADHQVVLHMADALRPVLVLRPLRQKPTASVIFLHGLLQSGQMLQCLAQDLARSMPHVRFVAPTAPTIPTRGGWGPAWYNQVDAPQGGKPRRHRQSMAEIEEILELEKEAGIAPERIVLAGFSVGGEMAIWKALLASHQYGGLLLISTALPFMEVLEKDENAAMFRTGATYLPVLQMHGESDPVISLSDAMKTADALRHVGCNVHFSAHRSVGHNVSPKMLEKTREWLTGCLPPTGAFDIGAKDLTEPEAEALAEADKTEVKQIPPAKYQEPDAEAEAVDVTGLSPLLAACKCGQLNKVRHLVAEGNVDIEGTDSLGMTPLLLASAGGHLRLLQYLLNEARANVSASNPVNGAGVLAMASLNGHLDVVSYLLAETDTSVDITDNFGATPLMAASFGGHLAVLKHLLDAGANVGATLSIAGTANGRGILALASFQGHLEIVRFLTKERGADVDPVDDSGQTPLHLAAESGHLEIVQYLLDKAGADADIRDIHGTSILGVAAYHGRLNIVRYLTGAGADVEAGNQSGDAPLLLAAMRGHLDVVKFLLYSCAANPGAKNKDGQSILGQASFYGHLRVVSYLIREAGADVEAASKRGDTPLLLASMQGHADIVKYLIQEASANVGAKNSKGSDALGLASFHGHLDVVCYLTMQIGADVESTNRFGGTPLLEASARGHLAVLKNLLEARANMWATNINGSCALGLAASNSHLHIVRYLLSENTANVEDTDNFGMTPLLLASEVGHADIVQYLLFEAGANFHAVSEKGRTCLLYAAMEGHEEVLQICETYMSKHLQDAR